MLAMLSAPTVMGAGQIFYGFPGLIIGAVIGYSGYYVYKKQRQRKFEKRMELITQNLDQYEKTDNIERLTLDDIKTIRFEHNFSYKMYLPGIIAEPGGFVIKDKRDYEEIKQLLVDYFSSAITVRAF
jgi:hypothetical protein